MSASDASYHRFITPRKQQHTRTRLLLSLHIFIVVVSNSAFGSFRLSFAHIFHVLLYNIHASPVHFLFSIPTPFRIFTSALFLFALILPGSHTRFRLCSTTQLSLSPYTQRHFCIR